MLAGAYANAANAANAYAANAGDSAARAAAGAAAHHRRGAANRAANAAYYANIVDSTAYAHLYTGYAHLAARMGPAGKWGPYREIHGLGFAGDYLWRSSEGRFVTRMELTVPELVALDELFETEECK